MATADGYASASAATRPKCITKTSPLEVCSPVAACPKEGSLVPRTSQSSNNIYMNNNTPETDALDRELHTPSVLQDRYSEMRDHAQKLERERDEALALLASEKSTRNAIIAQGVELEKQLEAMREVLRTIREEAAKIFSATAGLPDCGLIHQIASSALAITKLQPFLND
jgi:hypothetical protein